MKTPEKTPNPAAGAAAPDKSNGFRETSPYDDFFTQLGVPPFDSISPGDAKLVYISARFRCKDEKVRRKYRYLARGFCRFACSKGMLPVMPSLMYSGFLRESVPDEDAYWMFCSLALLQKCEELWVFVDFGISDEMQLEIDTAKHFHIPVRYFTNTETGGAE